MIVFLGLFYFLFGFSGSYFIESPPIDHTHPASVELIKETLTDNAIELKKKTNYNQLNEENQIQINENPIIRTSECPDVKSGVKTRSFIIMFLSSQLVAMFSLYLFLNFKTYGLTIINNDRYITILYILNGIAGGFGRFFWGFLVDKYSFKKVIIVLECFVFLAGIIFPFVKNPVGYYIIICFIAFFDGGLISIIGPGLLLIYGLNIGAKLLTIKGLSFFFALITAPLIGYFLEGSFGIDKVFLVLGCLNIFGIIMCFFIKMKYSWEIK